MPKTLSQPISGQSLTAETPKVVVSASFTAVTLVNVVAGQALSTSAFTLNTDAAPSTYPTTGNDSIQVLVQDQLGDVFPVVVTYTGIAGSSFTGCVAEQAGNTTLQAAAQPLITGTVSLNRTGTGGHPWLNTLTSATTLDVAIQSSADNGTTWNAEAAATGVQGGTLLDKHGNVATTYSLSVGPINPVANAVRMICTAHGTAIWISGTATVTSR